MDVFMNILFILTFISIPIIFYLLYFLYRLYPRILARLTEREHKTQVRVKLFTDDVPKVLDMYSVDLTRGTIVTPSVRFIKEDGSVYYVSSKLIASIEEVRTGGQRFVYPNDSRT